MYQAKKSIFNYYLSKSYRCTNLIKTILYNTVSTKTSDFDSLCFKPKYFH